MTLPMSRALVNSFIIYFVLLMIISSVLVVAYWPHKTYEERISALSDIITKDNAEKQEIIKKQQDLNSTKSAFTGIEKQRLSDRYDHLNKEIDNSQDLIDMYRAKINFEKPELNNADWIHLDVVKNFAITGLSALLASTIASFRSFYNFYGNRRLKASWTVFYIFRPWQGVLLAMIVYVIIRSGIQAGMGVTADQVSSNLFAIAAMGFVSGLYSEEVLAKFHEIFVTFFNAKDARKDQLTPPKKFPSTVTEVMNYTIFPDEVIVRFHKKSDKTDFDAKCPDAFATNEAYWEIWLTRGKEGVYWIRDSDQQIVCQYRTEKELELPDKKTESN